MKHYKGYNIERNWHNGYYVAYGNNGRMMADSLTGIKQLINADIKGE